MSLGHGASVVRDGLVLHVDSANSKSYSDGDPVWVDLSNSKNNGKLVNFELANTLDNPNAEPTTTTNDYFGRKVSVSNNGYVAVSTLWEDVVKGDTGTVYIFNASNGSLIRTLNVPGTVYVQHYFGWDIDINDNYLIVGVTGDDTTGNGSGRAYIYDNTTGNLLHTLENPNAYDTTSFDSFGRAVAINDNYAVVGTGLEDDAFGQSSGKVYVFNNTTGNLLHTIDNPNLTGITQNNQFGHSVDISDNYFIVGAQSGTNAVFIYENATGNLLHTVYAPNGDFPSERFGESVSISNNYFIVGDSYIDDAIRFNRGKAYIYDLPTGKLLHTLDNPISDQFTQYFGYSVSITDNLAVVGYQVEYDIGVYDPKTGALLQLINNPNADGGSSFDRFGESVSISDNYIVAGAREEDDLVGTNQGRAYIFNKVQSTQFVNDATRSSLSFNGVDDRVTLGDIDIITGAFTIDVWFKSAASQNGAQYATIVGKDNDGNFGNFVMTSDLNSTYIRAGFFGSAGQREVGNSSFNTDFTSQTWVNYVCTWDGSSVLTLYRNGEQISQNTSATGTLTSNNNDLYIGYRTSDVTSYFEGDISNVKLYNNKSLTANEVLNNFEAIRGRYSI